MQLFSKLNFKWKCILYVTHNIYNLIKKNLCVRVCVCVVLHAYMWLVIYQKPCLNYTCQMWVYVTYSMQCEHQCRVESCAALCSPHKRQLILCQLLLLCIERFCIWRRGKKMLINCWKSCIAKHIVILDTSSATNQCNCFLYIPILSSNCTFYLRKRPRKRCTKNHKDKQNTHVLSCQKLNCSELCNYIEITGEIDSIM